MDGSSAPALLEDLVAPDATAPDLSADAEPPIVPDRLPEDLTDVQAPGAEHHALTDVVAQYGQYVALFVGAGLISGSAVHFPLAPLRYAVIGAVGAAIFAAASILTDRASKDTAAIARVAIASLVLALGIGMISGSIQHFQDIPARAAQLIPLGITLSVAAFIVRNGLRPKTDDLGDRALDGHGGRRTGGGPRCPRRPGRLRGHEGRSRQAGEDGPREAGERRRG